MKTILTMAVVVAILLIAGAVGVIALNKQADIIPCSSCGNRCTAEVNCGNAQCGALNGGTCNCSSGAACGKCNGSCGGNCGSNQCSGTASATKTCGCGK